MIISLISSPITSPDNEYYQMLISHGDKMTLPVEEIAADEILTASGIFPLDEIPSEHLDLSDLALDSTARQTVGFMINMKS